MPNLKATDRNVVLGKLADILQSGKSSANQYQILPQVPIIGGTGLGDLFMGKAPELVDDVSYDGLQAVIRGGNAATGGIGTYGARPAVADAALLGMDVAGIGKGLSGLSRKSASALYDKLLEGGTYLSRRDALKKLGALAGSTAIAGTGVGVLRKLSDNVVSDVAHVAPKVADNVAGYATKKYRYNSLAEYLAGIKTRMSRGEHELIQLPEDEYLDSESDIIRLLLSEDEKNYSNAKYMFGDAPEAWENSVQKNILSPQAKAEMKELKQLIRELDGSLYGDDHPYVQDSWTHWLSNLKRDPKDLIEGLKRGKGS